MKKYIFLNILLIISLSGCQKFLDEKSEAKVTTPVNLQDLEALINNENLVNGNFCNLVETGTDDFQLTSQVYQARPIFEQQLYNWDPNPFFLPAETGKSWGSPYSTILYTNIVLEGLDRISGGDQNLRNRIKGDALFVRAYRFFNLAQAFAPVYTYNDPTNKDKLGIPLRENSNVNIKTKRNSLEETYQKIIHDLKQAIELLPEEVSIRTRPNKSAAYALLSRVLLAIEDYQGALDMAEACLERQQKLIDYNNVNRTSNLPFAALNDEVIYHSVCNSVTFLLQTSRADVSEDLYLLYSNDDLRKTVFFTQKATGNMRFKGYYNGLAVGGYFAGLATDEVYLTAAECLVRTGQIAKGMEWLNTLLVNRYDKLSFKPRTVDTETSALSIILDERRKEMPFRGTRWTDLRRLNKDSRFSKTLSRKIPRSDGAMELIELPPNDVRYTFLIPQDIIAQTGIPQNPRQ